MNELNIKNELLSKVTIDILNNQKGRIIEININELGLSYRVRYIDDNEIKHEWFYRDEITIL